MFKAVAFKVEVCSGCGWYMFVILVPETEVGDSLGVGGQPGLQTKSKQTN